MAYFVVQDFKAGLDRRRMSVTSPPGTLRTLRNAHINRGGEIEKRKAFATFAVITGTLGLAAVGGQLYAFGTALTVAMPAGVLYQRLQATGGSPMTRILSSQPLNGLLYTVAAFADGSVQHFYDGAKVVLATNRTGALNGRVILPFQDRMYSGAGSVLFLSGLGVANDYSDTATGSAFFEMSTQAAGSETLTGLANYQDKVAVFGRRTTQIWSFPADPTGALQQQVLRNIGTVSPRSVVSFADSDVFFLADSGIRSLRARDASNSASMSDVGTPIDAEVVEHIRTLTADEIEDAHGVIEPKDGQFWLALGDQLYVFSFFPSAKVSAWSTYDLPRASDAMVAVDSRVYVRAGDTVYLYGGASGVEYDDTEAEAELPYLDGRTIATWKTWSGVDIAAEGSWNLYVGTDPMQPDAEDLVGTITGHTMGQPGVSMAGFGPMLKLRLVSTGGGAARLGNIVAHYALGQSG